MEVYVCFSAIAVWRNMTLLDFPKKRGCKGSMDTSFMRFSSVWILPMSSSDGSRSSASTSGSLGWTALPLLSPRPPDDEGPALPMPLESHVSLSKAPPSSWMISLPSGQSYGRS